MADKMCDEKHMSKSRISLDAIAKAANTSVGTVDRALNNRGRINEETRQKILRISKELGYRSHSVASALGRQKAMHLAVIMPQKPHDFCDAMVLGCKAALSDLKDFGIQADFLFSDSLDPQEQEHLLQTMDVSRYAGIAINAGGDILSPYINACIDRGIPVVTFNSDVADSRRLLFVGNDAFDSGCLAGELMAKMLHREVKPLKIAAMAGFENVRSHMRRRDGFLHVMQRECKSLESVILMQYGDNAEKAERTTLELLQEHPDMDGLFFTSAPGAIGAGNALKKSGLKRFPVVIGYDVSATVAAHLRSGTCSALIYQDPYRQGYYGVKLLARHLLEKWQPDAQKFLIRSKLVLHCNLEDYLVESEKHQRILD